LLGLVRERTLAQRDHAAWSVLDERRVEHLLALDPRSLDVMSAAQLWRLATVFLTETGTLPGKVKWRSGIHGELYKESTGFKKLVAWGEWHKDLAC
jgi:hypothetical protein